MRRSKARPFFGFYFFKPRGPYSSPGFFLAPSSAVSHSESPLPDLARSPRHHGKLRFHTASPNRHSQAARSDVTTSPSASNGASAPLVLKATFQNLSTTQHSGPIVPKCQELHIVLFQSIEKPQIPRKRPRSQPAHSIPDQKPPVDPARDSNSCDIFETNRTALGTMGGVFRTMTSPEASGQH